MYFILQSYSGGELSGRIDDDFGGSKNWTNMTQTNLVSMPYVRSIKQKLVLKLNDSALFINVN